MRPHSRNMNKMARVTFTLLLAIFLLPACSRKQGPSTYNDGRGSLGNSGSGIAGDIIPGDYDDYSGEYIDGDWDPNGEPALVGRGEGNSDDMYHNGLLKVEGVLPSIYFGFDSASVPVSERAKLQQAADYLAQNSDQKLLIEGHCDWYGTSEYNLALGDRRASSVSDYLSTLGISPMLVDKLSKGSLEATSGLSKPESSQDRRADLIILKQP